MKFSIRALVVSAVAVGLGIILYFAVQALPNDSRPANSSTGGPALQNGVNAPGSQTSRPERPGNNRNEGIRWRSLVRIARRTFTFSIIVLLTVFAKNFLFPKARNSKK